MDQIYLKTRKEWRNWLTRHHHKSKGIWLVFYKNHTGKASLEYEAVVEECLCFGWIDSIIKRIDDEKYVRKVTPRKLGSRWSELNKNRIKKLQRQGLMTESGILVVREAKRSGYWGQSNRPKMSLDIPKEFENALNKNKKAKTFFNQLAPSYRKQIIGWISAAKREETKARRIKESVDLLEQGRKLGMK
jgi:uncharacterized protein YdeI (YjbR/CyaY-like superfamily)